MSNIMQTSFFKTLKFFIGWPLSLAALYFIFRLLFIKINTFSAISSLNYASLLTGIICFLLFFLLRSLLWNYLIRSQGYPVPFTTSAYHFAASELKRYIPGNIWSFLSRSIVFADKGMTKKDLTRGIIIEAELLVISSLFLSIPGLQVIALIFPQLINSQIIGLITMAMILLPILFIFQSVFKKTSEKYLPKFFHFFLSPFTSDVNARLLLIALFSFLFFGLGYYFTISALFPLPVKQIIPLTSFFLLSFVGGYLALVTPSGLGVREGIIVLGLAVLMPASIAALTALFSRIILILSELLFVGCMFLLDKKR